MLALLVLCINRPLHYALYQARESKRESKGLDSRESSPESKGLESGREAKAKQSQKKEEQTECAAGESPLESRLDSRAQPAQELCLLDAARIDEKPSLALPLMYEALRGKRLQGIYYASGPGNLNALKLTHIFLQSWSLLESLPLYATDSFSILQDSYIPAFGKKYFTLTNCTQIPYPTAPHNSPPQKESNLALAQAHITHCLLESPYTAQDFRAPEILPRERFCLPCEPLYILPPL